MAGKIVSLHNFVLIEVLMQNIPITTTFPISA